MSHFSVIAILPKELPIPSGIQDHLDKVMERYDENREVSEYEEECHCAKDQVHHWVRERMHEQFGGNWVDGQGSVVPFDQLDDPSTKNDLIPRRRQDIKFVGGMESFRESFAPIREAIGVKYPGVPDEWDFHFEWPKKGTEEYKELSERVEAKAEESGRAWKEHMAPWEDAEANYEIEAEKLGIHKPDPTCGFFDEDFLKSSYSDGRYGFDNGDGTWTIKNSGIIVRPGDRFNDGSGCGGTGKQMSTYNPDSKWDWYSIGGRWDGEIAELEAIDDGENGFNFGDQFHTYGRNLVKMADATDVPPYAFLTPDGIWIGKGEMGWGMSQGDEDHKDWQQKWEETRRDFSEHYAVQLDCHI